MKKIRREELKIIHKVTESGISTWKNPTQLCSDLPTDCRKVTEMFYYEKHH